MQIPEVFQRTLKGKKKPVKKKTKKKARK